MVCHFTRVKRRSKRARAGPGHVQRREGNLRALAADRRRTKSVYPARPPASAKVDGVDYFYFAAALPDIRVKADLASVQDLSKYEAFTCLKPGAKFDKSKPQLDRDAQREARSRLEARHRPGQPRRAGSSSKSRRTEAGRRLVAAAATSRPASRVAHPRRLGLLERLPQEVGHDLRRRWMGTSLLGEVWYAEADNAEGPVASRAEDRHARQLLVLQPQAPPLLRPGRRAGDLLRGDVHGAASPTTRTRRRATTTTRSCTGWTWRTRGWTWRIISGTSARNIRMPTSSAASVKS